MRNGEEGVALAWAARGGGGRRRGGGRRGGAEREGISASSISLFDVRPAPNSAVRATLSKWLGGHQRKCLGTTPPPVLLRLLTKPYRYSVLYRRSRLTFFPEREKEREWRGRVFRLSRRFLEKKENAPREGKKGRGKLCRPREKRIQKLGRIIFRSALSTVYTTNTSPSLFFLQRENRELFFFKFPRSDDAQASLSLLPPKRGGNVVCAPFLPEKQGRVINDPLYPGN